MLCSTAYINNCVIAVETIILIQACSQNLTRNILLLEQNNIVSIFNSLQKLERCEKKIDEPKSLENAHIFYSLVLPCFFKSFLQRSLFLDFTSLRSNRFHGKFRRLSHAKSGARAKKRKGEGERGKGNLLSPSPSLFFLLSPQLSHG